MANRCIGYEPSRTPRKKNRVIEPTEDEFCRIAMFLTGQPDDEDDDAAGTIEGMLKLLDRTFEDSVIARERWGVGSLRHPGLGILRSTVD